MFPLKMWLFNGFHGYPWIFHGRYMDFLSQRAGDSHGPNMAEVSALGSRLNLLQSRHGLRFCNGLRHPDSPGWRKRRKVLDAGDMMGILMGMSLYIYIYSHIMGTCRIIVYICLHCMYVYIYICKENYISVYLIVMPLYAFIQCYETCTHVFVFWWRWWIDPNKCHCTRGDYRCLTRGFNRVQYVQTNAIDFPYSNTRAQWTSTPKTGIIVLEAKPGHFAFECFWHLKKRIRTAVHVRERFDEYMMFVWK